MSQRKIRKQPKVKKPNLGIDTKPSTIMLRSLQQKREVEKSKHDKKVEAAIDIERRFDHEYIGEKAHELDMSRGKLNGIIQRIINRKKIAEMRMREAK